MANWNDLFGGAFVPTKIYPTEIILAGATGTIKTLTPPAGQRIMINRLASITNLTSLTSIKSNGVDVLTAAIMTNTVSSASSADNRFCIEEGNFVIPFAVDAVVTITTDIATTADIQLSYNEERLT